MGIKSLILLLVFSIFCGANEAQTAKEHAEFYKKSLPLRTNDNLTLTDILAIDQTLIYRYTLNDTYEKPVSKFKDEKLEKYIKDLEQVALKNSCLDKLVLNLLQNNIVIEHLFYFEKTKLLFEIRVDINRCQGFNS